MESPTLDTLQKPTGHGSIQTALGSPAWAGGLDELISRGSCQPQPFSDSGTLWFPASDWSINAKSSFFYLSLVLCCRRSFLKKERYALAHARLEKIPLCYELPCYELNISSFGNCAAISLPMLYEGKGRSNLGDGYLVGYNLWQLPLLQGDKMVPKRMSKFCGLLPEAVNVHAHSNHLQPNKPGLMTEIDEILATFHGGK